MKKKERRHKHRYLALCQFLDVRFLRSIFTRVFTAGTLRVHPDQLPS
jgi:hypothetical protein